MKAKIIVQNLKCNGCANTIRKKIAHADVSDININIEESTITFQYSNDNTIVSVEEMLLKAGYPKEGDANATTTKVKSFVSCAIGKATL